MTAGDHRTQLQLGRDWYRPVFLVLAVMPLLLLIPLFVGSPSLGTVALVAALVVGGLGGVGSISILSHGSRWVAPPNDDEKRSHATVPGAMEVTSASTYVPHWQPVPSARSGAHRPPDGGVSSVVAHRPERTALPDTRDADPPVIEGGTAAGRSPWRLPIGQVQSGIAADAAQLGDLEVRAASVIGPGHRCEEPATARQDAYALMRARSGSHLIVAVADGLSSSASSEIGARVAASAAVRILHQTLEVSPGLERFDAEMLFKQVAGEMVGTGRNRALDDRALCSVLIVAVIPAVAQLGGSRRVWTAQVGDVSLWLHGRTGWIQRTGRSKSGLDRNKVDAVLPFNPGQVVAGFVDVQPGQGVAVMTDGFGDTLSDVATAKPLFSERWVRPPHLARFVSDLCFDARGQDDDRTAVVVWCGRDT
jgi:serine/threonine protein phosphatase PrpC